MINIFKSLLALWDEDARADRSPGEFYQLDFEMSFVEQDDIFNEIEPLMYDLFKTYTDLEVSPLSI